MPQCLRRGLGSRIWSPGRASLVYWMFLLNSPALWATNQIPDEIRIGDIEASLCMAPVLSPYFAQNSDRDIGEDMGESFEPCDPNPDDGKMSGPSTALWRGYVASFAIVNGQLVVEQIWTNRFGWFEEWAPVIDCAMPETKDRLLDWFSGPLYYLRVDPIGGDQEEQEEYSLFQVDIDQGRYVGTKKLRSEVHGPNSGISCSAGWDEEPVEGPTTFGWCQVESIEETCADQSID
jgi:hypothetical protein